MLDQRRRRWADVVQILYKYFVFAGLKHILCVHGDTIEFFHLHHVFMVMLLVTYIFIVFPRQYFWLLTDIFCFHGYTIGFLHLHNVPMVVILATYIFIVFPRRKYWLLTFTLVILLVVYIFILFPKG